MSWCKCLSCPKAEVEDVTTLDFSCSSLTEVPPIVFNFERTLQYLYLDCNKIMELPRTLFQCEELRYLGLGDNDIETIPPSIEKLTNLENLLLNRNCLAYESIPTNIHRCQRLRYLHLSSNNLTKVPGSITRLVSLRELYLNNCDLEFLPANFGRLNNLRILELRENHLAGLPKSLKRLGDLRRLDISSNMFKKFPDVIGTMTNLAELWLNDNFISNIPDGVGTLHKLTHFDVSCNRLEKITNNIGLCQNITLLLLSMNDLKELPPSLGNLSLLHTLKVDHNLLEVLPQNIGNLSNLEELDVQFNNLKSFPASIGMLRKLNSLVAAQNSISYLPTEIGSCTALSVLSLHYNVLMYLPEELGHLQNLTSISLINNRLRYLPITILNLRKLKALWLSHNQSQPLIMLQTEAIDSGQIVLTCVFLPQVEMPLHIPPSMPPVVSTGRKIGFMEPNVTNDLPAKLTRIPTPHPKAFVKYQRTLENSLRKNQDSIPQNISVDAIYVKEANIVPMKGADAELPKGSPIQLVETNENNQYQIQNNYGDNKKVNEVFSNPHYETIMNPDPNDRNNNDASETHSECMASLGSERTYSPLENGIDNIHINDNVYDCSAKSLNSNDKESCYADLPPHPPILHAGAKPKQPPPYHIAAAYSKGAHLFLNSEKSEKDAEPKHFTQDQPLNILNPQPKHARCITQEEEENSYSSDSKEEISIHVSAAEDLEFKDIILSITSNLLRVDAADQQFKSSIEQFLQFSPINEKFNLIGHYEILALKLEILKTTEYLCCKNLALSHRKAIIDILDSLQKNCNIGRVASVGAPTTYNIQHLDNEMKDKLMLVDLTAVLLGTNYKNQEYHDFINHLLQILPQISVNQALLKPVLEQESTIQIKLNLIKILIYVLTTSGTDKDYKYIFGQMMHLRKKLHYLLNNQPNIIGSHNYLKNQKYKKQLDYNNFPTGDTRDNHQTGQTHNINWLFGMHRNPKIVKVELTPCCYVLGFSVNHCEDGVFIDEVDKNGNAFQKLYTGDKILMLDDRDISKMHPEEALKAVQVWGPETETFLISRK